VALPHNIIKKPLIGSQKLLELDPKATKEDGSVDDGINRLSYKMIFENEEAIKTRKLIPEEEVELMLEQRNVEWQKRVKLEQIKSHREGYDKGYTDGSREATEKTYASTKEEITQSFSSLQEAFNHIESNINELHKSIEAGFCSLVFTMAEQVIGIPVHHSKLEEQLKNELQKIFKSMDEAQKIELWCSPNDQQHIANLTTEMNLQKIYITADPELNPGEYRIETNNRKVIRDFKKSLSELQDQLTIEHWGKEEIRSDE
jgi:flagellar biosynthesis/type III secretory pathway protein FliH